MTAGRYCRGHLRILLLLGALILTTRPGRCAEAPIQSISSAFRSGDADRLASFLSENERTLLNLSDLQASTGLFGAGQALLILQNLFSSYTTRSFSIESKDADPNGEWVQAQGRWEVAPKDGTTSSTYAVFLRLRTEGSRWVLSEIRATRTGPKRGR